MHRELNRSDLERRIGARSFARLLGDWRPASGRLLAAALADRVRLVTLDGRLPTHTRVPAERELAATLQVSRTTVAAAYDELRAKGLLRSRRGAGSWTSLPSGPAGAPPAAFAPHADGDLLDLAHAALPAPGPLRHAVAAAVADLDAHLPGHGYDLLGLPVLRAAIARRFTDRGLPTSPDQVLVTAGGQQAITLAIIGLTGPGDRVLIEHPTYPNAISALHAHGVRPVPVPLEPRPGPAGAWDLDLVTAAVRDAAPRLAYLIPDHHNPTGARLDDAGRVRLVELARRTRTPLLIDETLGELPLHAAAALPVAAHGAADSPLVITVGSASKTFWGGLRLGWLRTAAPLVRRLAAKRAALDLGGPVLEQLVLTRLFADVEATAAARRVELSASLDHLLGRLAELLPGWRSTRPLGGLSLWVELGRPASSRLVGAARRRGVLLAAGPQFGIDGAFEQFLRLPFTLRRDRMDAALERLAGVWRDLDRVEPMVDTEPSSVA